jgi:hypothetical protein
MAVSLIDQQSSRPDAGPSLNGLREWWARTRIDAGDVDHCEQRNRMN